MEMNERKRDESDTASPMIDIEVRVIVTEDEVSRPGLSLYFENDATGSKVKMKKDPRKGYFSLTLSIPMNKTVLKYNYVLYDEENHCWIVEKFQDFRKMNAKRVISNIEVRVVVTGDEVSRPGLSEYLENDATGSKVEMEKDPRKGYVSLTLSIPMNKTVLKYNYVLYDEKNDCWILKEFQDLNAKRVISKAYKVSIQDVASFFSEKSWKIINKEAFFMHFPCAEDLVLHCENAEPGICNFKSEAITSIKSLKRGWEINKVNDEMSPQCYVPPQEFIDQALIGWMRANVLQKENLKKNDQIRLIISTLVLIGEIEKKDIYIQEKSLLVSVFRRIGIRALDACQQKILFDEIVHNNTKRILLAINYLFELLLEIPVAEFLFALPLYCIVHHAYILEDGSGVMINHERTLPYLPRSSKKEETLWDDIKSKFSEDDGQRHLHEFSEEFHDLYQSYPLIINTYCFLLEGKFLTGLVRKYPEQEIVDNLALDNGVFQKLLTVCKSSLTIENEHRYLVNALRKLMEDLKGKIDTGLHTSISSTNATLSADILRSLELFFKYNIPQHSSNYLLWCLDLFFLAMELAFTINDGPTEKITNEGEGYEKTFKEIISIMKKRDIDIDQMKFWNTLIKKECFDKWKKKIEECMTKQIQTFSARENKEEQLNFYFAAMDSINLEEKFNTTIQNKAFKCMLSLAKEKKYSYQLFKKKPKRATMVSLLDRTFKRTWDKNIPKESTSLEMQSLQFLFNWKPALFMFQLINSERMQSELQNKDLVGVMKLFEEIVDSIYDETILIKHLKIIIHNKSCFFSLNDEMPKIYGTSVDFNKDDLERKIKIGESFLEAYETTEKNTSIFLTACGKLTDNSRVNTTELQDSRVAETEKLSDAVTKQKEADEQFDGTFSSTENENHFRVLQNLRDSKVFQNMWRENADTVMGEEDERKINCVTAYERIFKPTYGALMRLMKEFDSGVVTLETLKMFSCCVQKIPEEMKLLGECYRGVGGSVDCDMDIRINQMCNLTHIQEAEQTIDVILNLKNGLELLGDFSLIENSKKILEAETYNLVEMTDVHKKLSEVFEVSQNGVYVWREFIKEKDLITWLYENMKDITEAKTFCDFAMISTENSDEGDRVACLLSAVMGFSPFLFNLEKTAGLDGLLERGKLVLKNSHKDVMLLKNWKDTGSQLCWFERLILHSSDEKQLLTLTREINKRGIYTIKRPESEGFLSTKSCISFAFQEETISGVSSNATEIFDLDKLLDIHSKLMLMPGEVESIQADVNQFIELLSATQSLAETFIKLVSAGCMLFNEWSATICCRDVPTKNLFIEVKFSDVDVDALRSFGSISDVNELSSILSKALERWDMYLDKQRMEYYFLNEFNIQQVIFLCRKLAIFQRKMIESDQEKDQVITLLSCINPLVCLENIRKLLDAATKIIDAKPNKTDYDDDLKNPAAESCPDKIDIKKRLVRELINGYDLDEDIAKAAVQTNDNKDLNTCVTWAIVNRRKAELIRTRSEEFDKNAAPSNKDNQLFAHRSISHRRFDGTLSDVIDKLQKSFQVGEKRSTKLLDSISAICENYHKGTKNITLRDYLGIGHLGKFLQLLHDEGFQKKNLINRRLKPPLESGQPNLVICGAQNVFHMILSLYMYDKEQSLPTSTEVLICTEKTSADEVERFLRRAMCKCEHLGQLLFVIAFAEKLSFNVSTLTENNFADLSQKGRTIKNYQLVILLCDKTHYLANCFGKYKVEIKCDIDEKAIAQYLKENLCIDGINVAEEKSAAVVDKEHSMVRIVSSTRSGVGKSLYIERLSDQGRKHFESLQMEWRKKTIRLLEKSVNIDYIIEKLYDEAYASNNDGILIHLDLTYAVQHGIEQFAFNLFVLGKIQNSHGKIWRRKQSHLYAVELTCSEREERFLKGHILKLLPSVSCYSPKEVLTMSRQSPDKLLHGMDLEKFKSEVFQRPYQYLTRYQQKINLDQFVFDKISGTPADCIAVLLNHCRVVDPSWAQLWHFASFLNVQLKNCENSIFCNEIAGPELKGLKALAVKCMIRMSQYFATSSISSSKEDVRMWEEPPPTNLFFNDDETTITFINMKVNNNGDLVDKLGNVKENSFISKKLKRGLEKQGVSFESDLDTFNREKKLEVLRKVMGIEEAIDPDPTYELINDNILKMLAIYMRFRCQIPVIIMGETGCGKTRMIEFMNRLKSGSKQKKVQNMLTLKVHGGVTIQDIHKNVLDIIKLSDQNIKEYNVKTTLFFDEANTTEAIHALKEVMCDLTVDGDDIHSAHLQLIAACNPYKKHSEEVVQRLEESGLGYRVSSKDTTHLFGNTPIRTLVYRVVELPPSMQSFVWDFGQLSNEAEAIYIKRMTKQLMQKLRLKDETMEIINDVFASAQIYMKNRQDECRYVSLRDVERCVVTYEWLYKHKDAFYPMVDELLEKCATDEIAFPHHDHEVRTLILTIGVCYYASLHGRREFLGNISHALGRHGHTLSGFNIEKVINATQSVFLDSIGIDENTAKNEALRENIFMMTVCLDMKIPLFLIGKPGSSKSLAKTIVAKNMLGKRSPLPLYQRFKEVFMLSYQCSALTHASGIESVFNQCSQLQSKQDLDSYSAVVVLDEIGLAEDSPNMPLKILHPLLECGSTTNDSLTEHDRTKKVGFVGISNWAMDPGKMNRGIFITRNKPDKEDLKNTAEQIFQSRGMEIDEMIRELLEKITDAYFEVYGSQAREYFGLRDYYSLIKMINRYNSSGSGIRLSEVDYAIQRNFSGSKTSHYDVFQKHVHGVFQDETQPSEVVLRDVIKDNLEENDTRFLLLLANHFSAVSLLQVCLENNETNVQVVFGSAFPNDHSYTDIFRNINRIKVCMETGQTAILLNMTEIHESLYDALNQHYVFFRGRRYVDLGLGENRKKCHVADNFRLIIVEREEVVYKEYPIPLINRLEKHHFNSESLLDEPQRKAASSLTSWVEGFTKISNNDFKRNDAFVGFHKDTVCSVVLTSKSCDEFVHEMSLLQSATTDAIFRLSMSDMDCETIEELQKHYLKDQCHDSLLQFLKQTTFENRVSVFDIISYSNILTKNGKQEIEKEIGQMNSLMLLLLREFKTEQEFITKLDDYFRSQKKHPANSESIAFLLVQCGQAELNSSLIACAKNCLMNKIKINLSMETEKKMVICFLLSTERKCGSKTMKQPFLLQHDHNSTIVYVDELTKMNEDIAPASRFYGKSMLQVLESGLNNLDNSQIEVGKEDQENFLVRFESLLKDCVCEAVSKEEHLKRKRRYFERIKILTEIFTGKTNADIRFKKILLNKIFHLLKRNEVGLNWIVEEACNKERLQEAGTFCKTVWLCLKRHISVILARIISIIDKHDNLNLLTVANESSWIVEMWLEMFQAMKLSSSSIGSAQDLDTTDPQYGTLTVACKIPFSFDLTKYFNNCWEKLSERNSTPDIHKIMYERFKKSEYFEIFAKALKCVENNEEIIEKYVSDLVNSMYTPETNDSILFNFVKKVVYEQVLKHISITSEDPNFESGDQIISVYCVFKHLQHYLDILSDVYQSLPVKSFENHSKSWLKMQEKEKEVLVHVHAFDCILQLASDEVNTMNNSTTYSSWKNLLERIKQIFDKMVDKQKEKVIDKLRLLLVLDLFIRQLLPSRNQQEPWIPVITLQAKTLYAGLGSKKVTDFEVIQTICGILDSLFDNVHGKLLVKWGDTKCRRCSSRLQHDKILVLPCNHFICEKCKKEIMLTDKHCPTCTKEIPDNHEFEHAALTIEQNKDLESFKSNCTSFFLEYLREFCFPRDRDRSNDMKIHVEKLIEECVVEVPSEQPDIVSQALDLNINTKRCILQILLEHDETFVVDELNKWMAKIDNEILPELIVVILNCFEHTMKISSPYPITENTITSAWNRLNNKVLTKVDTLYAVAEIRLACITAVGCMNKSEPNAASSLKIDEYLITAIKEMFNAENQNTIIPVLQNFIVKVACRFYGKCWFHQMKNDDKLKELFLSQSIAQKYDNSTKSDPWSLLGEVYKKKYRDLCNLEAGDILNLDMEEQNPEQLLAMNLALFIRSPSDKDLKKYFDRIPKSRLKIFFLLSKLNPHIISALKRVENITENEVHMLFHLIMFIVAVIESGEGLVNELNRILTTPKFASELFWPAMPLHQYFDMPRNLAKYTCPYGHLYVVGECGIPVETKSCQVPECKAKIGGRNHEPLQDNKTLKMNESSQKGYILNKKQKNVCEPTDRMTKQSAAVVHFFLHSCMLSGIENTDGDTILRMLNIKNKKDAQTYLIQQMQKNLQNMSDAIARNIDDTVLVLYKIIIEVFKQKQQVRDEHVCDWTTMQNRIQWENIFREKCLRPIFKNLDEVIIEMRRRQTGEDVLDRIIYEVDEKTKSNTGDFAWNDAMLWKTIEYPNSAHLLQYISDSGEDKKGGVLQAILEFSDLHLVKYLEPVLQLQNAMIREYQNKLDIFETEKIKLREIRHKFGHFEKQVDEYIFIWNQEYQKLVAMHPSDRLLQDYAERITIESSISMFLPSTRGRGHCAKILAEYLIGLQNNFLSRCQLAFKKEGSTEKTDIFRLLPQHFVCVTKEKDLLPLIHLHAKYRITKDTKGRHHQISYNLDALEKLTREKYVTNKRLIAEETLPRMKYIQDIGVGSDWEKVKQNASQVEISAKVDKDLDIGLEEILFADLCESVRTIAQAISFLAKVKTDESKNLCDFLKHDLLLVPFCMSVVPKYVQITHTLSLYCRLSLHRAVHLSKYGLRPYKYIQSTVEQVPITGNEVLTELNESFKQFDVTQLLRKLNEMLIRNPDLRASWSLREEIFPYFDFLDNNNKDDSWYQKLSKKILFENAEHLFSLAVEFKLSKK